MKNFRVLWNARSTEDKQAVVRRVKIVLEKPLTKAYLLFLCSALPIVNNFNRYMQQQFPILHVLYQELDGLIRKFLLRFMNSEYMCAAEHVSQETQKSIFLYTKFS